MGKFLTFVLALLVCDAAMAEPISAVVAAVASVLGATGSAVAVGALASVAAAKLMSPKGMPGYKPPAPMPTANSADVEAAKRRQVAAMQSQGGRASTILSQDDKLGG